MLPLKRIHFIGIGGVGMSAVAWVILKKRIPISGSDVQPNIQTARLEKEGVPVYYGHSPENVKDAGLIVVSSAIHEDNPELVQARNLKIPIWHRSDMLEEILSEGESITVAGTHGKTSTASMAALVLERAGLDPTFIIGGDLNELGGNARLGAGKYIVAEADESDGTFLSYHPQYAIVTNVEPDHLDFYKTADNVKNAFQKHLSNVCDKGCAILCADDPGLLSILEKDLKCQVLFYSARFMTADFFAGEINLHANGSAFTVFKERQELGQVRLSVPGRHNIINALSVIALGDKLGLSLEQMTPALREFKGAKRRFQLKGTYDGITVIDDYAHHPTEVATTLASAIALRESKKGRIIAIFQPHRYTRTRDFHNEFAGAFKDADVVIITDIYPAGEKPISGVSGRMIYDGLVRNNHPNPIYVSNMDDICNTLISLIVPGDVIFTMGAGNIWKVGDRLLQRLTLAQPV
ncbi:MAG TPA: UDP-N-acetylmuramate--L-alanine ligase [Candidatus Sumerlaeia bacterium]|nr:UDP-N-acetylmuramate--L-alanine ligase [Candidatus Sumerlaeia bacterium]